jgi:ribosome biogenesis GTPase / thiamine phosphate phosphatase
MTTPSHDLDALTSIGWREDEAMRAVLAKHPESRIARVIAQHRSGYQVSDGAREFRVATPRAWLKPDFDVEDRPAVGDWVLLHASEDRIETLLSRRTLLKRAAAGEQHRTQLIAANVDHVLVVCGLDLDFNPRRLERYHLLTLGSGARMVLVLTKADLCPDLDDCLEQLQPLAAAGVPIHAVNARDAASLAVLSPYFGPGSSSVLVGSSGAGKSTLTNTLLGIEKQRTFEVRAHDSRGRHTTTHRALIRLPSGGCLIDTPGMRELKLSGDESLDAGAFDDIETLAAQCRFRDCAHEREPGCAVQAALEAGELDPDRYANYAKLHAELAGAVDTLAVQQAQKAEARILGKALRKRLTEKYGKQ